MGSLYGVRFEDWIIILIVVVCLAYLLAIVVGEGVAWWNRWQDKT